MADHPKISALMRRKIDKAGNEFFVGRCRLPVNIQLDRFIMLVFPFAEDKAHGEDEGAELVFELAHEDNTFRHASKTLKRVADKIKEPKLKDTISEWLESIADEEYKYKGGGGGSDDLVAKLDSALKRAEEAEDEVLSLKEKLRQVNCVASTAVKP